MAERAVALLEVIMVIGIMAIIIIAISAVFLFYTNYIETNMEQYNIHAQINYAAEDMKLRCISASRIDENSFFSSLGGTKAEFKFLGENDIYNITPNNLADNVWYTYAVDANGDLVLSSPAESEVLVDAKYKPALEFRYTKGDEPNFLTVNITAANQKVPVSGVPKTISKKEGARFWFVDIVR